LLNVQKQILACGLESIKGGPWHIEVREYSEEGLVVLNYNQTESPKADPLVMECRGLILNSRDNYSVVARSFDRFFNYGEVSQKSEKLDFSKAITWEKADGSLMTCYHFDGKWRVASRGMAFAEGSTPGGKGTFGQVFRRVLPPEKLDGFPLKWSFAFELVSPETRVVRPYAEDGVLLLTVRDRETGEELPTAEVDKIAEDLAVPRPKRYVLSSLEEAIAAAKALPQMEEGYVCLWEGSGGFRRLKVKNPAYLAVAHLRGNGDIGLHRKIRMALTGEATEYLSYFPEDLPLFAPIEQAIAAVTAEMEDRFVRGPREGTKKEFAEYALGTRAPWVLFEMLKGAQVPEILLRSNRDGLEKLVAPFLSGGSERVCRRQQGDV